VSNRGKVREDHSDEQVRRRNGTRSVWSRWKHAICEAPGWWLSALLVFAPWAYGATFPQTKDFLAGALLLLVGLFVILLLIQRRWPRLHLLSVGLAIAILGQGWLMALNPKLVYDPAVQYFHFVFPTIPWLPGTVDRATTVHEMWLITGLFGAFWVASDLGKEAAWRDRFWLVMSVTGVSLAALGLFERVTRAPAIFWRGDLHCETTFFATYRYHANAGCFINISLLLIAARMVSAFQRGGSTISRSFWIVGFVITLASAFVNVSRAATLIGVIFLCAFLFWAWGERRRSKSSHLAWHQPVAICLVGAMVAGLLVWAIGFKDAYERWADFADSLLSNGEGRFLVYGVVTHSILPVSGWWGFGPGTFHLIFPFFTNSLGTRILGYWEYAHEDYLQTLVEWGFCGATAWFLFFGQTVARAVLRWSRWRRTWDGNTRRFTVATFVALLTVLAHSAVDFPLQIASLQLYATVLLGLIAAWPDQGERRLRRRKDPAKTAESLQLAAGERPVLPNEQNLEVKA
jgi:O-Antigen ligase